MERTPKKLESLNTTILSESGSSANSPFDIQSTSKRFSRSKSDSRSKSKDQGKLNQQCNFFVKNICKEVLTDKPESHALLSKFALDKQKQKRRTKREGTPAKDLKQGRKSSQLTGESEVNLQKQLNLLKIQKQLNDTRHEKSKLQQTLKIYEQKINKLSLELDQTINQNNFLQQKLKHLQKTKQRHPSNAINLKKLIVDNKDSEGPDISNLQLKIKALLLENNSLRQTIRANSQLINQMQTNARSISNERQQFLGELVQQMKLQLSEREKTLKKMQIQLNISLIKQARGQQRTEIKKDEQLEHVKKKYMRVLLKYHQISQELAAFKRKNQRMNGIFSQPERGLSNSIDSLSLSP